MYNMSRRDFLKVSAIAASSLMISTGLSGCGSDDNDDRISVSFNHGVASGDPLSDKVIIWTRVTHNDTQNSSDLTVSFEVSTDETFSNIVNDGTYTAKESEDFTVKIDVQNLTAGTKYFYRFISYGKTSDIGIAKTLPATDVNPDQVKMAVFTCANYPNGYFNAYTEASKITDLDVSIHVGDYIYEYGMYENDDFDTKTPAYATSKAQTIGRVLPDDNNTECIELNDYRKRYALYHTDSGTQAIHAACPMIVVWDDHEIANDSYKDGAQNHDDTEGDFNTRTQNALQAYFEWLPIRPIDNKKEIFRSFDFGNLVSLHMLETRIFGRDEQLSYTNYYNTDGSFKTDEFTADLTSTTRTMLGSDQLTWLQGQLTNSSATWQVLGQQVLMGRMSLPAEILTPIGMLEHPEAYGTTKEDLLTQINSLITEFVTIKTRILQGDTTVTTEEQTRLATVLPYNLDAWDGYFFERETILGTANALGKKLVVLAGDTHNAWASNLTNVSGEQIGVEFATPSVTSPGLEDYVGLTTTEASQGFEGALQLLIDDLQYTNTYDRGFMTVTFTTNNVEAKWNFIDNYDSTTYNLDSAREKAITVSNTNNPLVIS
ncbi:MAG: alkaline phosphatase D family protein [Campylobacterota bacterium]|nr:alkaline phosphatase D family protein [Campylobacterota bacterium]